MPNDVVLLGGTFDPVHNGHLIVARAVAEWGRFDRVTLVPTASPPHKTPARAPGPDRLEMLRLATEGEGIFEICDLELRRMGPSYTIDTLTEIRRTRGADATLHWVIGADMLEYLHTWSRATEVVAMARILTMTRPPWHLRVPEIFTALTQRFGPEQIRRLRQDVVSTPLIDISSTEIRRRIGGGLSVRYLIPDPVRAYIQARGLYRSEPTAGADA